jgi:hypothetical protein
LSDEAHFPLLEGILVSGLIILFERPVRVGDQVTIIIPADNPDATWAAVEASL